jgi:hypothetical protein
MRYIPCSVQQYILVNFWKMNLLQVSNLLHNALYAHICGFMVVHIWMSAANFRRLSRGKILCQRNRYRRVCVGRHIEAGQYVAQSGLHLHQSEPHSCKNIKNLGMNFSFMWMQFLCFIFLFLVVKTCLLIRFVIHLSEVHVYKFCLLQR